MREAITNSQPGSKPKVDQSKSKGQLSILDKAEAQTESSPTVVQFAPVLQPVSDNPSKENETLTQPDKTKFLTSIQICQLPGFEGWSLEKLTKKLNNAKTRKTLPVHIGSYVIDSSNQWEGKYICWQVTQQ